MKTQKLLSLLLTLFVSLYSNFGVYCVVKFNKITI